MPSGPFCHHSQQHAAPTTKISKQCCLRDSVCGSVGEPAASDTSHQQVIITIICIETTLKRQKRIKRGREWLSHGDLQQKEMEAVSAQGVNKLYLKGEKEQKEAGNGPILTGVVKRCDENVPFLVCCLRVICLNCFTLRMHPKKFISKTQIFDFSTRKFKIQNSKINKKILTNATEITRRQF